MRFEDKYGILALVAARHPEDRTLDENDEGVWDRLLQNISKKPRESMGYPINTEPLSKMDESRL